MVRTMKLAKAIEIGQQYRRDGEPHDLQDFDDFIALGIEALKCIDLARRSRDVRIIDKLPGETDE